MKLYKLHSVLFLLLVIFNYQSITGITPVHEPEQIRHFDDDFKQRYSGRKFNYEGTKIVTETPTGSGKYEEYKNEKVEVKEKNDSEVFSINLGPLSWLFYIALAVAVIFLVYFLINDGTSGLFTSNRNKKLNNLEEITSENIESTDINSLIKNAENNNDYRLAIRYYYLLLLKTLSLKNYIKFEDDKTNAEYLNEISNKPFCSKFEYTSYLYNYIWYGKFPLNITQYTKAKDNFTTLLNTIK